MLVVVGLVWASTTYHSRIGCRPPLAEVGSWQLQHSRNLESYQERGNKDRNDYLPQVKYICNIVTQLSQKPEEVAGYLYFPFSKWQRKPRAGVVGSVVSGYTVNSSRAAKRIPAALNPELFLLNHLPVVIPSDHKETAGFFGNRKLVIF